MKKIIPFLLILCTTATLIGQTPQSSGVNMAYMDHLPYSNNELSDVWGYADQAGNEYALVGTYLGESIVDVSNPRNLAEIAFLPGANSIWRDIKTFGQYAYVSNETGGGLRIINLHDLPDVAPHKDTIINGVSTIHNLWVDEAAGRLYLTGINNSGGGMVILDVASDPWNPHFLATYTDAYVHDVYVRDNMAYTAEIYEGRLRVLDVSLPDQIDLKGDVSYSGGFTHNTWLNDAGTVCFTTDEYAGASVYAWDVSDPTDIQKLSTIRSSVSNETAIPHNVHVLNDFLVISYYRDGIVLVDASQPGSLIEVGHYDSSPMSGGGFNGVWGAYPFLPSGLILASDIEQGLVVLKSSYPRAARVGILTSNAISGEPLEGVTVEVAGDTFLTDEVGRLSWGSGKNESVSFTFSKEGYVSQQLTVDVELDAVFSPHIEMRPLLTANEELISDVSFELYPNPVRTMLQINLESAGAPAPQELFVELSDVQGKVLAHIPLMVGSSKTSIPFPYPAGVYSAKLKSEEQVLAIRKVICVR